MNAVWPFRRLLCRSCATVAQASLLHADPDITIPT